MREQTFRLTWPFLATPLVVSNVHNQKLKFILKLINYKHTKRYAVIGTLGNTTLTFAC